MGIKHTKISAVPDGEDSGQVQGSDWNADHAIDDPAAVRSDLELGDLATIDTVGDDTKFLDGTGAWTVPAGGASRPTFPSTISNLQLRLSAEYSTITKAQDLCTLITDISGNSRDASNGSSNGRPRYFPHRFNNKYPCFSFDGTNNLHLTVTMPNIAAPMTIVMVLEELGVGTSDGNLYRDASSRAVGYLASSNSWSIFGSSSGFSSTTLWTLNRLGSPSQYPAAMPCIRMDLYNNASSLIALSGTEETGTATCSGTILGGVLHIGNNVTPASAAKFLMYEFLVYDKALSSGERIQLNEYYRDAVEIGIL